MTEAEFEARLKSDGFQEVERCDFEPRPGKGRHRHLFAIRGLVLSGRFFVKRDAEPVSFGPGQIFEVAEGALHDEWIGDDGARVLIGRKFPQDRAASEHQAAGVS